MRLDRSGAHLGALEVADERLVHLDNPASPAERGEVAGTHGFADAVGEEPRALVPHLTDAAGSLRVRGPRISCRLSAAP